VAVSVAPAFELPFADDSAIRRVHGEGILLLGGGRALLMQLAHPSVARGVGEHSSFRHDRLQRLLRTLRPIFAIVYGSREQAVDATESINCTHDYVHGEGYDAHDPELLLWVWATLFDTALELHRLFVRSLASDEANAYYRDIRQVGELLGVPSWLLPADVKAFEAYVQAQVGSLHVSDQARRIAGQIFRPMPPQWAVMWPLKQLTSGLLPPPLRDQYGLTWGPNRQLALDVTAAASRRLLPLVPRRLRRPPGLLMPPS
jgi:uncharacterized protein (DUF2236 family)